MVSGGPKAHSCLPGGVPSPPGRPASSGRNQAANPTPGPQSAATARGLRPGGKRGACRGGPGLSFHRPSRLPRAGRVGAADRPGRLPAPAAAASAPRRRRRRLARVADPGRGAAGALETPPCRNPTRGLCVLSNYLFIEKKRGGEKKKEVTCPGYTYAKRSSRRRKKLRRAGGGEAAAEVAATQELVAAAARPGTDTHLYECACGS